MTINYANIDEERIANAKAQAIEDERFLFKCPKCNEIKRKSYWAVAQLSSGHKISFACVCGQLTELKPFEV